MSGRKRLEPRIPKPSEVARQWHPHNFSDTVVEGSHPISRPALELQLEDLTTNRKETEFEEFARLLAQREICPNLLPQTGPVGGGDSHTDTESVPVSDELARCRFWGPADAVMGHNWAFAISAQRDFSRKVRGDLQKIAALDRKYERVYFITNQPVADKKRRELETELARAHGFDVRILDRTWIVEKVLERDHVDLLRKALRLEIPETRIKRTGPRDLANRRKLDELLAKFGKPYESYRTKYELASDYVRAGKLAARLEQPRFEIDAYFDKGFGVANEIGHVALMVEALYHKAWRAYWWFDDFDGAAATFRQMLPLLERVVDAATATLFNTLHGCLLTGVRTRQLTLPEGEIDRWDSAVQARLEQLAAEAARPNNALHARTTLLFRRLSLQPEDSEALFAQLGDCLVQANGLGHYPFLDFVSQLEKLGEHWCDQPGYLPLIDRLAPVIQERAGETKAARSALTVGYQLLRKDRFAEALPRLVHAGVRSLKEETRQEAVRALGAAAVCLEMLGLLWAARSVALSVLNLGVRDVSEFGRHADFVFQVMVQLARCDFRLGRVGPFLAWHHMAQLRVIQPQDERTRNEDVDRLAVGIAALFAGLKTEEALELRFLVKRLNEAGLALPAAILELRAGENTETSPVIKEVQDQLEHPLSTVAQILEADARRENLPDHLNGELGSFWTLETTLYGVRYALKCQNLVELVWIAEEMLGALECTAAFLRPENTAFLAREFMCILVRDDAHRGAPKWVERSDFDQNPRLVVGPDINQWLSHHRNTPESPIRDFVLRALLSTTIDPPDDVLAQHRALVEAGATQIAYDLNAMPSSIRSLVGPKLYALSRD